MRLDRAAVSFDKSACVDAYSGKLAFLAQIGLYADSARDSETHQRRVFSTHPDVTIPPRRVVTVANHMFIIGHGSPDTYKGRIIRIGWVAHEATALTSVKTLAQACTGAAGVSAWSGIAWIKNSTADGESSNVTGQHHIHFAVGEAVKARSVVLRGTEVFLVRESHEGPAGTRVTLCDQLDDGAICDATFYSGTYDRLTEVFTGASTATRVVRTRWQSLFEYSNHAAPKFGAGDIQIAVAKSSITPVAGQRMTLADGAYQIESALDEGDVWLCRATRHA